MPDSNQPESIAPRKSTGRGGYRPGAGRKPKAWHQAHAGIETDADVARRNRRAAADIRCLRRDELAGRLVDKAQIDGALTNVAAAIRQALERLPDTLAPRFAAEADETRIATLLADELERVLVDLAHDLKEITHEQAPTP